MSKTLQQEWNDFCETTGGWSSMSARELVNLLAGIKYIRYTFGDGFRRRMVDDTFYGIEARVKRLEAERASHDAPVDADATS